jgi:glycosyltransferase domain-containing protein
MTSSDTRKGAADCTIIILVHNRQHFVPRLLDYLSDFPGEVHVHDSSQAPLPPCSARPFKYVHVPGKFYHDKMRDAAAAVTTSYVVDCPDDDFILKNSIEDAIVILEANPGVAAVRGRTLRMSGIRGRIFPRQQWVRHAKRVRFSGQPLLRQLINLMRTSIAMAHAVHRRDALLRTYQTLVTYRHLKPVAFMDWLATYVVICSGGARFIARPMSIRDETRLISDRGTYPAELEIEVPFTDLARRLREQSDPLAPMLAAALGSTDIEKMKAINQKILIEEHTPAQMNYEPRWLAARFPIALSPEYQGEVDEVLAAVARHRSLADTLLGRWLNFPGVESLILLRDRVKWRLTRLRHKLGAA